MTSYVLSLTLAIFFLFLPFLDPEDPVNRQLLAMRTLPSPTFDPFLFALFLAGRLRKEHEHLCLALLLAPDDPWPRTFVTSTIVRRVPLRPSVFPPPLPSASENGHGALVPLEVD